MAVTKRKMFEAGLIALAAGVVLKTCLFDAPIDEPTDCAEAKAYVDYAQRKKARASPGSQDLALAKVMVGDAAMKVRELCRQDTRPTTATTGRTASEPDAPAGDKPLDLTTLNEAQLRLVGEGVLLPMVDDLSQLPCKTSIPEGLPVSGRIVRAVNVEPDEAVFALEVRAGTGDGVRFEVEGRVRDPILLRGQDLTAGGSIPGDEVCEGMGYGGLR